jgi:hypothetical protein
MHPARRVPRARHVSATPTPSIPALPDPAPAPGPSWPFSCRRSSLVFGFRVSVFRTHYVVPGLALAPPTFRQSTSRRMRRSHCHATLPPRSFTPRLRALLLDCSTTRPSQRCRARSSFVALLQCRRPYAEFIGSGASADTAAANPIGAGSVRPDPIVCFSEAPGMAAREQSLPSDRGRTNHNPSGPFPFPARFGSNSVRGYVVGEELDYPDRQRHPSGRDTLTFRLLSQVQDGLRWRDGRIGLHGHLGQHGQVGHLRMKRVPVPHLRSTRCSPLGNY